MIFDIMIFECCVYLVGCKLVVLCNKVVWFQCVRQHHLLISPQMCFLKGRTSDRHQVSHKVHVELHSS